MFYLILALFILLVLVYLFFNKRKGFSASAGAENTATHEFVHLLDQEDGAKDGMPEHLLPEGYAEPWMRVVHAEMKKMKNQTSTFTP